MKYPSQLTAEKANESDNLTSYLDVTFMIGSGGKLSTRVYDKRDDFDFHIDDFHLHIQFAKSEEFSNV